MSHGCTLDAYLYCDECGAEYKECFWCGTLTLADHAFCTSCASAI
jgi:hypothetical protein